MHIAWVGHRALGVAGVEAQHCLIGFIGTIEQLGEKVPVRGDVRERHASGAKALFCFVALAARLKPCPDYKASQIAFQKRFSPRSEVVP